MKPQCLLFCAALLAVYSTSLHGAEPPSIASYFEGSFIGASDQDAPEIVPEGIFDKHVQQVECASCGSSIYCGDSCSSSYCRCRKKSEHDSCIDWILPRSNLPLPLFKEKAEERGATLPLPLGTSVVWTEMDRTVVVTDLRLGIAGAPPTTAERLEIPETNFHASTKIARLDLWTLPCVNVYGVVGHTRSTGEIAVTVNPISLPVPDPVVIDIPVELEGPTGGFGVTTGIGGKKWFAMLDVNKTWTKFSTLDSSLTALVIAPRLGLVINRPCFKGEVHVGAMYQDTAQTVEVVIDDAVLGNDLLVEVDQIEPRPWNFLVGGMWALDERLQLMVEGGMGGRSYVISGITVRY